MKMRNLLLLGALLMTSGGMMAQTSLSTTKNAKVVPGYSSQGDATISFQVPAAIGGWQMELTLPEGLKMVEGSAQVTVNGESASGSTIEGVSLSSAHKSHALLGGTKSDGTVMLICFPTTTDAALTAQSGQLCTIKVKADDSYSGTKQVTVKSFLAADPQGSATQYTMAAPITFDVVALKGDLDANGEVDVLDIEKVISDIVNKGNNPVYDLDGTGEVDVLDIEKVINEILL